ncbi:cupin domain-containing protein [Chloroflexota bacterium]
MATGVKVVKISDIEPKVFDDGLCKITGLITKTREHIDTVTVSISMLEAEFDDPACVYEENDEILYQLEGDATITWEGGKTIEFHPGMVVFTPKGVKFRYKCHNKNKHIVIWAPAFDHYD